ncbi:SDR family oxidoreductase [Kitasatospora herbaricolor]|uniref:SDR family oxidoreductase n=1 Tax=Kitasatospora herbaricolor TaxID=68217 RepID=UPI0039A418FC
MSVIPGRPAGRGRQGAPVRGARGCRALVLPNAVEALVPNDQGRFGEPAEIAAAVAYLCGAYAQYVCGATIRVDGGLIRSAF